MKQITVRIKGGSAQVETSGYVGAACKDATAQLEAAMGIKTADDETPEFHQREVQVQRQ